MEITPPPVMVRRQQEQIMTEPEFEVHLPAITRSCQCYTRGSDLLTLPITVQRTNVAKRILRNQQIPRSKVQRMAWRPRARLHPSAVDGMAVVTMLVPDGPT
jgi:hypothetical protein